MSNEITGVVQEVRVKDVSGGRKSYDLIVGGQAYGAGLYAPKAKAGDYVKFEVDESRGYKNIGRNTLKVSANKAPAEAIAEAAATAPAKSTAGGSVDMKQEVISRQSALNSAIEWMKLLQSVDSLPLPAAGNKGKKQEAMEQLLDQYKITFYETNTGVKYKELAPKTKTEITEDVADSGDDVVADSDNWQ